MRLTSAAPLLAWAVTHLVTVSPMFTTVTLLQDADQSPTLPGGWTGPGRPCSFEWT